MRRFFSVAVCLALLAACESEAGPLSPEDSAAVRQLGVTYAQAVLTGNVDAVVALYTEDAVEMPPNTPVRMGLTAIRAGYEGEQGIAQAFTVTSAEIDGRGDLAYDRGTWSWTGMMEGMTEPITETGKYVAIAREQEDDSWLWHVVIWNSDTPLPGQE